jgi:hypothetical protein
LTASARQGLCRYSLFEPFGYLWAARFSAVRRLGSLPLRPFNCLRSFSLQRGRTFPPPPIWAFRSPPRLHASARYGRSVCSNFGLSAASAVSPLQRGRTFAVTPFLSLSAASELARFSAVRRLGSLPLRPFNCLRSFPLQRGRTLPSTPIWAFRFPPRLHASAR